MSAKKSQTFVRRRLRVRNRLRRCAAGRPRLTVHRSNRNISAQIIDDSRGVTLAAASTMEKSLELARGGDRVAAGEIGSAIARRALDAGIAECYFDRGGYLYHGRVKALADAARTGGLKF